MPGTMLNTLLFSSLFNKICIIKSPILLMRILASEKLHNLPEAIELVINSTRIEVQPHLLTLGPGLFPININNWD